MAKWMTSAAVRAMVAGGLLLLAACQSGTGIVGDGAGASTSGTTYLHSIRAEHGLTALKPDATLERAALQQATYMASSGRMAHTTGRGKDFAARMNENGVAGAAAENIAYGGMEPAKLFSMWMNSDGHRRNMLDPRFSRFGLAYVRDGKSDRRYWALVLGR